MIAIAAAACGPPKESGTHGAFSGGAGGGGPPPAETAVGPPGAGEPVAPAPDEVRSDPPPAAAAADEPDGILSGIVAEHNEARARHCAPPLKWSSKVAKVAQAWADDLRKRGCVFEHSPGFTYGENLAFMSPSGIGTPESVVDGWYREVGNYDFRASRFSFESGHFTQVVWVETTQLGCGRTECKGGEIWVCNYNPPGNVRGQFKTNVLPERCTR